MKYQIITVGGATRDITFLTDEGILIDNHRDVLRQKLLAFEYGAKIKIDRFHNLFGGGAANAAVNFAVSGFKTACLARVGKDEGGRAIVANLRQHGVATSLLSADKKLETGMSFILVAPGGERIIFTSRAANNDLRIRRQEEKILNQADWLYLASLSGDWLPAAKKIFSLSHPKIAWNPGASQYQAGLKKIASFLKRTAVFCLNKDEAIELVLSDSRYRGQSPAFLNSVKNLLVALKAAGPEIVLITGGQDGADVYDGHTFYHQAVLPEKKRVDITGVGDVFNSSFVAGLELSGGDIRRALYLGAKNTAAKIANFGAQNGLLDLRKVK
ncbi:MAG: carbohydrate kinase family protein [Patescibacteria group bacterium]|nr:carbohydrate kinase family protein [Patescibacteria group bacterium]